MDPSIFGKKIKELYPQYASLEDSVLGQKYMQKYGASVGGVKSGQIKISDIPIEQRSAVGLGLESVGFQPEEKINSAEEKKKTAFASSTNLIDELERKFTAAKGGEFTGLGAIIGGTKKNIGGALNIDKEARIYNRTRQGFVAALKDLTGDVGVLTDKDYERISNLLPKFTDDPQVARELFNTLRSQMAAKYGGEKMGTKYKEPEVKGGALAAVFPGLTQMYQESQQDPVVMKALETAIPALQLRRPSGRQAASEVLTILGGASLAKAGASKIKGLTTKRALANRSAIASEQSAKISGERVYKKAEEKILRTVSETDRKPALKMLEQAKENLAGQSFDAQTALDKLTQYNKAYTTTGRAGKSAKAAVNDALSKALRE